MSEELVKITYDHREKASGIPRAMVKSGKIEATSAQLPVGDYILSDRLIVERKTLSDLDQSIRQGRLKRQIKTMSDGYAIPVLLIEQQGNVSLPDHVRRGALISAIRQGVSVLIVQDKAETVEYLIAMARKEHAAPQPKWDVRHKKVDTPEELSLQIIGALPGVGRSRAYALLEHFGTLQALFSADQKALKKVSGIGTKGAKKLAELFTSDLSSENIEDPFANPNWGFLSSE